MHGVDALVASMKKDGWKGSPIDVVRMTDGSLVTVDNTRLLAASRAGIDVKVKIHDANEKLSPEFSERFTTKSGGTPNTWEEAVKNRINNQSKKFRERYPIGADVTSTPGI